MTDPTVIGAYLALFFLAGFIFLLVNLVIGWLVRPNNPHPEKKEIYECGEPAIGSSFVQFDLRFYVIALVFIVFDAEVAFLFPVATVFGKATNLMGAPAESIGTTADGIFQELGVASPGLSGAGAAAVDAGVIREMAGNLGWMAFGAIHLFFIVLLIGFAYEWQTGSLDWIRAAKKERADEHSGANGHNDRAGPVATNPESVTPA